MCKLRSLWLGGGLEEIVGLQRISAKEFVDGLDPFSFGLDFEEFDRMIRSLDEAGLLADVTDCARRET